ncbi:MAG: Gfo/Idh/MocA family protein [Steroidobacter sp.]
MAGPIRLAVVGVGKIARDQHVPALAANCAFRLVAAASHHGKLSGVPSFADLASLLNAQPGVDAVSICTPPAGRHAVARVALDAGLHVMLEKPPGLTVADVEDLAARAARGNLTLFAAWHSREAACVTSARAWLADRSIASIRTTWKENIRVWHPGQHWILDRDGFGVFDPGINALSILTHILPRRLKLRSAMLRYPENRQAPIAAELDLLYDEATPAPASFDFLHEGRQQWDIEIDTDRGALVLSEGGQRLHIDGVERCAGENREYPGLYARFAQLIARRACDVDTRPLQLALAACTTGVRIQAPAFEF